MTSQSIVRPAVPDDKPEMWRLLRLLHSENAMFKISDAKVNFYLDRFLHPKSIAQDDTGPRGFIGVIGPVAALEGCIMLSIGSNWYSEEWSLDEYFNFVDPHHRASHHSLALIDFAKDCAERVGIRLVIGVLSTKRTAAKVRLYGRRLTACGAFFVHPAPEAVAPPSKLYRVQ